MDTMSQGAADCTLFGLRCGLARCPFITTVIHVGQAALSQPLVIDSNLRTALDRPSIFRNGLIRGGPYPIVSLTSAQLSRALAQSGDKVCKDREPGLAVSTWKAYRPKRPCKRDGMLVLLPDAFISGLVTMGTHCAASSAFSVE